MTSILREFEKTMKLEPIQVNYTEPSILDSVDLSNATSTLSFSNYEISFDKSEVSFDEEDNREQEPPKSVNNKVEPPFSLFYVGGKGVLSTKQLQSLKDYLISSLLWIRMIRCISSKSIREHPEVFRFYRNQPVSIWLK